MKRKSLIIAIVALLASTSCRRMPLYDMEYGASLVLDLKLDLDLELDLDVDVDIKVDSVIQVPEHMKALFFNPATNGLQYTEFVGGYGGEISTPPGTYNLVVYSFGTEYTQIRGEGDLNTLEAFTSDITDTKSQALRAFTREGAEEPQGPIIYAPDHLLVANEKVTIPEWTGESQTIVIKASARTILETYTFEVHSVVGAEYIESCEAFVTNQARSSFFGRGEVSNQPATLSFPIGVDRKKGCLYTTFNTFGKLPGDSHAYLHILIIDTGGTEHRITEDITDQFEDPEHHIIIEEPVVVPEPASHGGGIAPTVKPWDEEIHNVPIG